MTEDAEEKYIHQCDFLFAMPYGQTMKIMCSHDCSDIQPDENIENVSYKIYYNNITFPFICSTKMQAVCTAYGIQWGAQQMTDQCRNYGKMEL